MKASISRRKLFQTASVAAVAAASAPEAPAAGMPGPRYESKDTPKIALSLGDGGSALVLQAAAAGETAGAAAAGRGRGAGRGAGGGFGANQEVSAKRIKQLGVDYVLSGGGPIPWTEDSLKAQMDRVKSWGLTLANLMITEPSDVVYNRPNKDKQIEAFIQSIRAAGKVGLPVIEYNWYAHRITEGYFAEIKGRGDSGWTTFDVDHEVEYQGKTYKVKDLPPLPNQGAHTLDEEWTNITYFLKAVVPEAEKAGVRLALHPNDPPAPISRGSEQIMGSIEGWKKLVNIVKSPSNGITFDCGVTREMGGDPVEVARYFLQRDCINHVHFRNVKVYKPKEHYSEVWIDEGENNMFAVMRELVKGKYTHLIYPEHCRQLDYDKERPNFRPQYPGSGGYAAYAFNVGYARAMMQAALTA